MRVAAAHCLALMITGLLAACTVRDTQPDTGAGPAKVTPRTDTTNQTAESADRDGRDAPPILPDLKIEQPVIVAPPPPVPATAPAPAPVDASTTAIQTTSGVSGRTARDEAQAESR